MPTDNFSANPHIWLENNNYTQTTHSNDTGRIGSWSRSASVGYTHETLLKFDVSSLVGATVTAVELEIVADAQGSQTGSTTAKLYEQNKTNYTSWSSPPEFDDFAQTVWDTTLQTVTVQNTGTYTFLTSASLVAYVQSWIDDAADNWGLIVDAAFGAVGWYLNLDETQTELRVTYTGGGGGSDKTIFSTAGSDTFSVPAGVTSLTAKVWSGGGGGGAGGTSGVGGDGAGGGYVQGDIAVTPFETLAIHVAGKGNGGSFGGTYSGGGGGGAGRTSIFRGATPLLIAGAGGGGGGGDNSSSTSGGDGGEGGGNTAGDAGASGNAGGGDGGTQVDGGAGGTGGANSGVDGGGPPSAVTDFGNCLNFDGESTTSVIITGYKGITGTAARSMECLIKSTDTGDNNIISYGVVTNTEKWRFYIDVATGKLRLEVQGGYIIGNTVINDGEWHRVGVTMAANDDVEDVILYVDGSDDGVSASSAQTIDTSAATDMRIGAGILTGASFDGLIDDVRLWSDVRTPTEMSDNAWIELVGDEAGLEGYWKMNQSTGTVVDDETSNNRDGDTTNMNDADWVQSLAPSEGGVGGDGADGSTGSGKGGEANGGITNGGNGGEGDVSSGYGGGGGGGDGYSGGGGGSGSQASNAGGGGGGGGPNYIDGSLTATTNSQATGQTPPNTGDGDYTGSVGVGGDGGSTSNSGSNGNDGLIVLDFEGGTNQEWGQSNVGDLTGAHTDIKAMGGTSPSIDSMTVTHLWYYSEGSGTLTIALYTGGELNDAEGATRITEAHDIAVVAGWNKVDVPNVSWPKDTVTWLAWAKSAGANTRAYDESANAGDFQTARGRFTVSSPANYDETTALPTTMGAGSFFDNWHSVFIGYTYPTDIFNGGMRFDHESSQYLESVSTFDPSNFTNVSVSFWMRLGDLAGTHHIIGCHSYFEILMSGNQLINDLYQASSGNLISNTEFIKHIWYHIVCTRDSSNNAIIYVNAVQDNTSSINSLTPSTANLQIGHRTGATGEYFAGNLEDVRIYNRVITLAEVQTIYGCEGIDGIVDGLEHRWFFNEWSEFAVASGSGAVKDLAGVLDMTPTNSPIYGGSRLKFRRRA